MNERLRNWRMKNGFLSRQELADHLMRVSLPIKESRLKRLEAGSLPTPYEVDVFDMVLSLDANCYISGKCHTDNFRQLQRHAKDLNEEQVNHLVNLASAQVQVVRNAI